MTAVATDQAVPAYPQYEGLLEMARESVRRDGGFVDPVKLRMAQQLRHRSDWATSVLGGDYSNSLLGMHMLLLAHGQDIDPPLPAWLAEVREKQEAARRREEQAAAALAAKQDAVWALLWRRMPVYVGVAYNYSGPHHYESYTSGAVHVILCADLTVGKIRRVKGWALCTTESAVRHQLFAGFGDHPSARRPSCKACIRMACRIVGVDRDEVLAVLAR